MTLLIVFLFLFFNYDVVVYLLLVLYLAAVYLRKFRLKQVAKKSCDLRALFSPRNGCSLHIFAIFKNNGSICVSMFYIFLFIMVILQLNCMVQYIILILC